MTERWLAKGGGRGMFLLKTSEDELAGYGCDRVRAMALYGASRIGLETWGSNTAAAEPISKPAPNW